MKLKSHFYLGTCLLRQGAFYASPADRAAFLAGCVEPDLNAVTYLKGSFHGQKLRGHNFPNLIPRIRKLIFHLEYSGAKTPVYFYRLGKLIHYLADAFTWPHNTAFAGTLLDHILYEEQMEKFFLASAPEKIRQAGIIENDRNPFLAILEQHSAYLKAPNSIQTDIDYITRTVSLIFTVFSRVIGTELLLLHSGGAA